MTRYKKVTKSKVKVGDEVYVDNKVHVVAEILSARGKNNASQAELEKPYISVYRMRGNTILKRTVVHVGTDYTLRPESKYAA